MEAHSSSHLPEDDVLPPLCYMSVATNHEIPSTSRQQSAFDYLIRGLKLPACLPPPTGLHKTPGPEAVTTSLSEIMRKQELPDKPVVNESFSIPINTYSKVPPGSMETQDFSVPIQLTYENIPPEHVTTTRTISFIQDKTLKIKTFPDRYSSLIKQHLLYEVRHEKFILETAYPSDLGDIFDIYAIASVVSRSMSTQLGATETQRTLTQQYIYVKIIKACIHKTTSFSDFKRELESIRIGIEETRETMNDLVLTVCPDSYEDIRHITHPLKLSSVQTKAHVTTNSSASEEEKKSSVDNFIAKAIKNNHIRFTTLEKSISNGFLTSNPESDVLHGINKHTPCIDVVSIIAPYTTITIMASKERRPSLRPGVTSPIHLLYNYHPSTAKLKEDIYSMFVPDPGPVPAA